MTVINAPDLERLRNTHPHKIIPHLSVFKPVQLYCGTVTGSPAMGEHQITVVNVSGSLAAVDAAAPDLMVYVGDSCGTHEKSKRRFRSRVGQVITLDENSVEWANGDVITIMLSYDLWAMFPYIDPDSKTFYKDLDIPYTDENELMKPVAIMGPHQAKFLDGPTVVFDLDGSDSYAVSQGAAITGYTWEATGGNIANLTDPTTTITFDTPGTYIITLTVTDSNAKIQTTRRVYFVHQRTGAYAPYSDFSFEHSPEGDWDNGGWSCGVAIRGVADQDEFPDNALCVLWAEMFWDDEEYYIVDGYNIIMVGYITSENVIKELDTGIVSFDIGTIHQMMENVSVFSVSLEYNTSPDTWWKMDDLTVGRAIHHMWRWHSTLFTVTDVFLPILTSNTELLKAVDDFEGGNLYSIVDAFSYQHSIFAHVVCNKYGQVYVEQDFAMLDEVDRAAGTSAVILNDRDRRGPMDLDFGRQPIESICHAIVSGTSFDGTTAIPVIAQAPGYVPSPYGENRAAFERLVLEDQAYANMIAGRVIAVANGDITEVSVPMAGNWLPALDIAPQNWIQLNVQASDIKRGISLEGYYHLRRVTSEIQVKGGSCLVDLMLVPEEFGPDGVPGPYPSDWPWPNFPLPEFPEFPPWAFPRWDTLMVRNQWDDGIVNYTPYQGTVINDPSSILPANDGDEVTNLLASSQVDYPVVFVTDGISIFFNQKDGLWGDPNAYKFRIYRHDIATGAADYLIFPYENGDALFIELTCIDINIVAVFVWGQSGGLDVMRLYEMNFNTGVVTEVYTSDVTDDIHAYCFCYTVQSTVNVYTIMMIPYLESGSGDHVIKAHRYNWTTGVSDVTEVYRTSEFWSGINYGPFPPVVAGYEIFWGTQLTSTDPLGKGYIHWFNFVTREYGTTLLFLSGVANYTWMYHSGYYRDLERIYFMVRTSWPSVYYEYYISTLTKEIVPVRTLGVPDHQDHYWKIVGNKQKCWRLDYYDVPAVYFIDPSNGDIKLTGSMSNDYGNYFYLHPKVWSGQVDDIDERIWSFQGHYIIGQGSEDVIIAETGITAPTGANWDYMEVYLYVLGRTFVVYFHDWNSSDDMLYVVHYPGSLVI